VTETSTFFDEPLPFHDDHRAVVEDERPGGLLPSSARDRMLSPGAPRASRRSTGLDVQTSPLELRDLGEVESLVMTLAPCVCRAISLLSSPGSSENRHR